MNTNNNVYTIIYTTLIVVVVAALLAFVSQSLKGRQEANEKAETISQMLTAAQYGSKAELDKLSNADKLAKYGDEIEKAFVIDTDGNVLRELEGIFLIKFYIFKICESFLQFFPFSVLSMHKQHKIQQRVITTVTTVRRS